MNIFEFLKRQPAGLILGAGLCLVIVLAYLDHATGPAMSFVVFYLIPVFLVAWYAGSNAGALISLASGVAWFAADMITAGRHVTLGILGWNVVTKLGLFLIVNYTAASLRASLDRERELARTDYLTKVANSRYFTELAQAEINRAGRYYHPFTVAYLDIDNFKTVNDEWGHSAGDELLALVAQTIRGSLRLTDVVARLGGDEFALLLPETGSEAAQVVVQKVYQSLIAATERRMWPVTFSVGVVTFMNPPGSVDDMIKMADGFMYSVKHAGKNKVMYKEVEYQTP